MGNRGQKRVELAEELPADKRVCNSVELRPGSSAQNSDGDMDTSNSMSSRSNSESDSPHESCDSESSGGAADRTRRSLREYQRSQSSNDQAKVNTILSTLTQETSNNSDDISATVAALTELCEVLCLCNEDSVSTMLVDSLSPILVKLAKHEASPDIMLLAIRAITHLCYIFPRAAGFLARHDAVPALCQRLMTIEYLDVAEECLQALEKISHDQPLACLQSGVVMAALNYIDFFSTSVQRRALCIAVNICKKLPSECPSSLMEAVPVFCTLLQYEDQQIIENAAACLIKIADRVTHSPEMLDELCKHGLIQQVMQLIQSNTRFTQSLTSYSGFISLLVKLASGSFMAFKTLHELNISSLLKDILSFYDISHGMSLPNVADGRPNQVHEVLKLLNELLPSIAGDQNTQLVSEKESFLVNQPDLLRKFGMDVLPNLMQVLKSGANLYVCYGCLSIINKTVYFSKSDLPVELFKDTNVPSFLAGVLTRKDHHLLMLALQILEAMLQNFSNYFLNIFVKEGVFFAVDMLLKSDIGSGVNFLINSDQKSSGKEGCRCLCYAFGNDQSSLPGPCKLEKDCVHNLANHIRTNYIEAGSCVSGNRMSNTLEELKNFSAILSELMSMSGDCDDDSAEIEDNINCIMEEVLQKICGAAEAEPVSTFEFVESKIVKSLLDFLSSGMYLSKIGEQRGKSSDFHIMGKQFKRFARLSLYSSDQTLDVSPLLVLIRKLQNALSSVENFPVILSSVSRLKNSYATVPNGGYIPHPCLRVCFVKREGETGLSDYSDDYVTVDPFSSLDAIEGFLWRKVSVVPTVQTQSAQATVQALNLPSNATSSGENLPEPMDSDTATSVDASELQENKMQSEVAANSSQTIPSKMNDDEISNVSAKLEMPCSSDSYISVKENSTSCSYNHHFPKLELYLDGDKLDRGRNLYQSIILRQMKIDHELVTSSKLWTQLYKITYSKASNSDDSCLDAHCHEPPNFCLSNNSGTDRHCAAFIYGIFDSVLGFDLDESSATYDILLLLKSLEAMNRFSFHLASSERITAFSEGRIDSLENLQIAIPSVPQSEFVSSKLTEKLEQQMRDPLAVSVGGMPLWCNELIASCPFLIGFDARCKYFRLAAFGSLRVQPHPTAPPASGFSGERRRLSDIMPRKKFLVDRDHILDSAAKIMEVHVHDKSILEVEYKEEVGTGLGPTVEFFTLVSHEFQKSGLGMWREDQNSYDTVQDLQSEVSGAVAPRYGLFPRPWSSSLDLSNEIQFSEVMKKFVLLGQIVAKALHDGRVLDLPLSRAFYKLVLGQSLSLYDIHLFDPELGRALLEFKALVDKKRVSDLACGGSPTFELNSCSQYTKIEDLCLDFTLPGYPGYTLTSGPDCKMVNMTNLEEYISLIVDSTLNSGISRQVGAFKSGFNQVFPIEHLHMFNEEELERLLCGEQDSCKSIELLDHIKFDHGYTASSPPILNLLEIIQEFEHKERRAFVQFVTGAPRLPLGGLASLSPKLTIVRKHSDNRVDDELPSVMTCANYLKLPPYTSKEMMKEKLLYAITEGQGSFHLS